VVFDKSFTSTIVAITVEIFRNVVFGKAIKTSLVIPESSFVKCAISHIDTDSLLSLVIQLSLILTRALFMSVSLSTGTYRYRQIEYWPVARRACCEAGKHPFRCRELQWANCSRMVITKHVANFERFADTLALLA
jgi:hypothetical protein